MTDMREPYAFIEAEIERLSFAVDDAERRRNLAEHERAVLQRQLFAFRNALYEQRGADQEREDQKPDAQACGKCHGTGRYTEVDEICEETVQCDLCGGIGLLEPGEIEDH